mmetsp:Transcript_1487/g.4021  ORF Transcript_1487/g.4021 Transcript_1487/m.4021 type:complete len:744 (+) Transcript_1487:132-2363(+)
MTGLLLSPANSREFHGLPQADAVDESAPRLSSHSSQACESKHAGGRGDRLRFQVQVARAPQLDMVYDSEGSVSSMGRYKTPSTNEELPIWVGPRLTNASGGGSSDAQYTSQGTSLADPESPPTHAQQRRTRRSWPSLQSRQRARRAAARGYDIFVSYAQHNAQDAIIAMLMFLREARPGLRAFASAEQLVVDTDHASSTELERRVRGILSESRAIVFFITDGVFELEGCMRELRWAMEFGTRLVFVRETDSRHGGVDMKEILAQAPPDLHDLLQQRNIVPWYREKGFRGVSVNMILKEAVLLDNFVLEARKKSKTIKKLEVMFEQDEQMATFSELFDACSPTVKVALFLGGFAYIRWRYLRMFYVAAFHLCFLGGFVLRGLVFFHHTIPCHFLAKDLMSTYLHIPAWQCWRCWRRYLMSAGFGELVAKAIAQDELRAVLDASLNRGGCALFVIQCIMVADALVAWALPETRDHGWWESGSSLLFAQAMAAWVVTPLVVCSLFASIALFGFTALLHQLDIKGMQDILPRCVGPLAEYYGAPAPKASAMWRKLHPTDRETLSSIDQFQRRAAHEEDFFQKVIELLVRLVDGVQERVNGTCAAVAGVWMHLFLCAAFQVLQVSSSVSTLAVRSTCSTHVWWLLCEDVFHAVSATATLVGATGALCSVTTAVAEVPALVARILAQACCPASRQSIVLCLLSAKKLGVHILFGGLRLEARKAAIAIVAITALLVDNIWNALGARGFQR